MTPTRHPGTLRYTLVLALLLAATPVNAQLSPLPTSPETDSDAPRSELADLRARKRELSERLAKWEAMAADLARTGDEAQARIQSIEQEIAGLQRRERIVVPADLPATELDAQLIAAEQDLAAARAEAMEIDSQVGQRTDRRRRLPELLSLARQRLKEIQEAPAPTSDDPAVAQLLLEIEGLRKQVLRAEIEAYQNELASYDARGALLAKRRDRATLRIAYYDALSEKLRELKQAQERASVERETQSTKQLIEELTFVPKGVKETLQEIHERNEALASVWTSDGGLNDQIKDVSEKLSRAESKVAEIQTELTRLAARVDAVGLADSVGALLRRHRAEAPDIGMYRRFIRMRQEQIGLVQLQQIKLREQREALADIDSLVDDVMSSIDAPMSEAETRTLEELLQQLFETQRRYMDALIEQYETYFQKLVDFDAQQQELIDRTRDLLDFIDERILWIPSGRAIQVDLVEDGGEAISWLLGPTFLAQLGRTFRDAMTRAWPLHILALLLFVGFFPFARRSRSRLRELGQEARSEHCVRFAPTAEAVGLSLLLAAWLPALVMYVGWRLGQSPAATQYARSIADALLIAGGFWASLRVARQLMRPNGIAESHCGWPAEACHALWRDLRWLTTLTVPMVFMVYVFEARGEDAWRESVGRLFFVAGIAVITVFNVVTVRDGGAISTIVPPNRRRPWAWRLFQLAAFVVPVGLVVAALLGFYWTTLQFAARIHLTLLFFFLLGIAMFLAARLSMIGERREALEEERLEEKPAGPTAKPTMQVTRLMVGTGLLLALLGTFIIWADLLPAARILQKVELWSSMQTVTLTEADPTGVERITSQEQLVAVTLADVLRALLIGLLTLALVRALPGVLEATVFRRLGPGERYAYVTIVKYAVVLGGLAVAFDAIGVGWSSIQWLVAAIGLGLGFGLQEIFANFVSGLIILFERPIRVGDTVSVGEIHGTVSKIRIRATWITGFDRKELIVPNKTFVTGQLVNWTLSDPVLRLDVPVGIAYGSDTDLAVDTLKRVAVNSVRVLHDPPPVVWFVGFGDSSLSFELRVFVRGVEQRFRARHELHMEIDKAFRAAGIEIAFPQRDLHVRSVPDAWKKAPPTDSRTS